MNKSESIAALAKALSVFQGEVKDVLKDKKGFNYSYGDLSQVLEISRPLLCKNGLSISQLIENDGDKVGVQTILMHESGEWISGFVCVTVDRPPLNKHGKESMTMIQAIGSVVTYLRRYAITSMVGITQTDDDGSFGMHENGNGNSRDQYSTKSAIKIPSYPIQIASPQKVVTTGTYAILCNEIKTYKVSDDTIEKWKEHYNVHQLSDLSEGNAKHIINKMRQKYDNSAPEYIESKVVNV